MQRHVYRAVGCRRANWITMLVITACAGSAASLAPGMARAPERDPIERGRPAQAVGCASCHTFEAALSHPVDMVPTMRVPAELPLKDGRVTCATCHDEALAAGHENGGGRQGGLLRAGVGGASLCTSCHASEQGRAGAHERGLGRAHLATLRLRQEQDGSATDGESVLCIACHDGATASDAGNHRMLGTSGMGSGDHPIGVPLDGPRQGREELHLKARAQVDPRVRLFNGKVGCGSCHSVYAPRENHLVMSNGASALCLSCHIQ